MENVETADALPVSFFMFFYLTNCSYCERARDQLMSVRGDLSLPLFQANCEYSRYFCVQMNITAVPAFAIVHDRQPVALTDQLFDSEHYLEFLTQYGFLSRLNSIFLAVPAAQLELARRNYAFLIQVVCSNSSETYISQNKKLVMYSDAQGQDLDDFVRVYSLLPVYDVTVHNYTHLSLKHKRLILADRRLHVDAELYQSYTLGVCDEEARRFFKLYGNVVKIIDSEGAFTDVLVENGDLLRSIHDAFDEKDNRRRKSLAAVIFFVSGVISAFAWSKHGTGR